MFGWFRWLFWEIRSFFIVRAIDKDIQYRRKMIRKLCAAVERGEWDTCDKISHRLYGKPYHSMPKTKKAS